MYGKAQEVYDTSPRKRSAPPARGRRSGASRRRRGRRSGEVSGRPVLNFCANNYLGLSSHPEVHRRGAGRARRARATACRRVRFICGTQDLHRELERGSRAFFGTEDAILYSLVLRRQRRALRDAARRGGRHHLRRAQPRLDHRRHPARARPSATATRTATWRSWRRSSRGTQGKRLRMIATDGVFSMDGDIAQLDEICDLAERYGALVMVDDSPRDGLRRARPGAGTPEHCGVQGRVDVITSHARQGARRRGGRLRGGPEGDGRPAPPALAAVPVLEHGRAADRRRVIARPRPARRSTTELRDRLMREREALPRGDDRRGLPDQGGDAPDRPHHVLGAASQATPGATRASRRTWRPRCSRRGSTSSASRFPVVPKGQARIRVQLSAAHTPAQVDRAVDAFTRVGKKLGVLK